MGIDEILTQIRRPETTVPICLRGDLAADYERLDWEFQRADGQITVDVTEFGASAEAEKIAQQMEAIRTEMQEATQPFRLRALARTEWLALAAAHPAHDDDEGDIHERTFVPALVAACAISPEMTWTQAEQLHGELSDGQWTALATAAWSLNRDLPQIPFSLAANARAARATLDL